jgi:acetoin utilization deacetylase AcuC-like enzyme
MIPIIYSEEFLQHNTGYGHPECAARLKAVVEALKRVSWQDRLEWRSPTPTTARDVLTQIERVHTTEHIQRVQQIALSGGGYLDEDTIVSPRSYEVALLAVSGWLDGVDLVLDRGKPVFVLARPPGHHAVRDRGMGFCLFSNAAIAANYALTKTAVSRVAILDWDVHHGNGTEAIVEDNPQIIYCSLHQSPCYPGTGQSDYRGKQQNILNLPTLAGSTIRDYEPLFIEKVIPFLQNFQPDIIIVSAGYDANHQDPLASISLQPEDYGLLTKHLLKVNSRLLFGLEGGYHLEALGRSVVATLTSCL